MFKRASSALLCLFIGMTVPLSCAKAEVKIPTVKVPQIKITTPKGTTPQITTHPTKAIINTNTTNSTNTNTNGGKSNWKFNLPIASPRPDGTLAPTGPAKPVPWSSTIPGPAPGNTGEQSLSPYSSSLGSGPMVHGVQQSTNPGAGPGPSGPGGGSPIIEEEDHLIGERTLLER